jgi:hypothetical protein
MSLRLGSAFAALAVIVFAVVAGGVHLAYASLRVSGVLEGDLETAYLQVPYGDATRVETRVAMKAGSLLLMAGGDGLMEITAATNVPGLEPKVVYEEESARGLLLVEQIVSQGSRRLALLPESVSTWHVRLGTAGPLQTLSVTVGGGDAVLDLRGVPLDAASVLLQAGTLELDLDGAWQQNAEFSIVAPAGTSTVYLPDEVGVLVSADEGLGMLTHAGLRPYGDHQGTYVNAAYGSAPVTLTVVLEMGLGRANLLVR